MLKIIIRTALILLAAGIIFAGAYLLVNGPLNTALSGSAGLEGNHEFFQSAPAGGEAPPAGFGRQAGQAQQDGQFGGNGFSQRIRERDGFRDGGGAGGLSEAGEVFLKMAAIIALVVIAQKLIATIKSRRVTPAT